MPTELFLFVDAKALDRDKTFLNFRDLEFRSNAWEAVSLTNDPQIYLYDNLNMEYN